MLSKYTSFKNIVCHALLLSIPFLLVSCAKADTNHAMTLEQMVSLPYKEGPEGVAKLADYVRSLYGVDQNQELYIQRNDDEKRRLADGHQIYGILVAKQVNVFFCVDTDQCVNLERAAAWVDAKPEEPVEGHRVYRTLQNGIDINLLSSTQPGKRSCLGIFQVLYKPSN